MFSAAKQVYDRFVLSSCRVTQVSPTQLHAEAVRVAGETLLLPNEVPIVVVDSWESLACMCAGLGLTFPRSESARKGKIRELPSGWAVQIFDYQQGRLRLWC
jgi:hypothetical protein